MKATMIIDCSITLAWCFADETTKKSTAILDRMSTETAMIPGLWYLEVVNVLAHAERRKRITTASATQFIRQIGQFRLQVDNESPPGAFDHILPICRSYGLTSYDATYLELALRHRLPLASLDDDLRKVALKLGVAVLGK